MMTLHKTLINDKPINGVNYKEHHESHDGEGFVEGKCVVRSGLAWTYCFMA